MLRNLGEKLIKSKIGRKLITEYYFSSLYQEEFFANVMQFLKYNEVEGDYLEFGVFGGNVFGVAHRYMHRAGLNMKMYGFDSFQGLPKPEGIDDHAGFKEGHQAMSIEEFRSIVKARGVKETEYVLVPGFFSESLRKNPPSKIGLKYAALVYIDCVLYESTVAALDYVLPLLQTGTIIAFDDFYCFKGVPERGEQRALKEFLEKNPQITLVGYLNMGRLGKSFIVKKHPN
jgi:hypothetical protein